MGTSIQQEVNKQVSMQQPKKGYRQAETRNPDPDSQPAWLILLRYDGSAIVYQVWLCPGPCFWGFLKTNRLLARAYEIEEQLWSAVLVNGGDEEATKWVPLSACWLGWGNGRKTRGCTLKAGAGDCSRLARKSCPYPLLSLLGTAQYHGEQPLIPPK